MAEYICADLTERPGCKVSPFWERRERIVRCRDCDFYEDGYCTLLEFVASGMDNGFCAWGEPRKEA